jgi:hypothetical protein
VTLHDAATQSPLADPERIERPRLAGTLAVARVPNHPLFHGTMRGLQAAAVYRVLDLAAEWRGGSPDRPKGWVAAKVEQLAEASGLCAKTVRRALGDLRDAELIVRWREYQRRGKNRHRGRQGESEWVDVPTGLATEYLIVARADPADVERAAEHVAEDLALRPRRAPAKRPVERETPPTKMARLVERDATCSTRLVERDATNRGAPTTCSYGSGPRGVSMTGLVAPDAPHRATRSGAPGGGAEQGQQPREGQPPEEGHREALTALEARRVLRLSRDRSRLAWAVARLVAVHPQLTGKYRGRELTYALDVLGQPGTLGEAWPALARYAAYLAGKADTKRKRRLLSELFGGVPDRIGGSTATYLLAGAWRRQWYPDHYPEPDLAPALAALSALGRP